jgi:hypothetical protein
VLIIALHSDEERGAFIVKESEIGRGVWWMPIDQRKERQKDSCG